MESKSWHKRSKITWYDFLMVGAMIVMSVAMLVIIFVLRILPLLKR
jgi:hypothetical protein